MLLVAALARPQPAAACGFALGFQALHDRAPEIVGACVDDESHDPATGDAIQHTTAHHGRGGLLVWRKSDNWTAFTDGARTWIDGPYGLQQRLNSERFDWEGGRAVALAVPPAMRSGRLAAPRQVSLPPGFAASVFAAGVVGARA